MDDGDSPIPAAIGDKSIFLAYVGPRKGVQVLFSPGGGLASTLFHLSGRRVFSTGEWPEVEIGEQVASVEHLRNCFDLEDLEWLCDELEKVICESETSKIKTEQSKSRSAVFEWERSCRKATIWVTPMYRTWGGERVWIDIRGEEMVIAARCLMADFSFTFKYQYFVSSLQHYLSIREKFLAHAERMNWYVEEDGLLRRDTERYGQEG